MKGSGLLTILNPPPPSQPRPLGLAKAEFTGPDDFNPNSATDAGSTGYQPVPSGHWLEGMGERPDCNGA